MYVSIWKKGAIKKCTEDTHTNKHNSHCLNLSTHAVPVSIYMPYPRSRNI